MLVFGDVYQYIMWGPAKWSNWISTRLRYFTRAVIIKDVENGLDLGDV